MKKESIIDRVPVLVYADDLSSNTSKVKINGCWHIAKPLGFRGLMLKRRIILAWWVFIGKCDAVRYAEDYTKQT